MFTFIKSMNVPNRLTMLRIVMVVPFLVFMIVARGINGPLNYSSGNATTGLFVTSAFVFIFAMATDYVDGYLARKTGQVTTFGKLMDPVADKIITSSAMILLSAFGVLPLYFTLIFILRDIIVDASRNVAAAHNVDIAASWIGKYKTAIQSFGLVLVFFIAPAIPHSRDVFNPSWPFWLLNIPIIVAAGLSIYSGYKYFVRIVPFLKTK